MMSAPRYTVEHQITSVSDHEYDATVIVRRNGKLFHVCIKPAEFVNSPQMTEKYLAYLDALRSGEEVTGNIHEDDAYAWIMKPFEPLFVDLAPDPPRDGQQIRVSLKDHAFPEYFVLSLQVSGENMYPRQIPRENPPFRPSFVRFDDSFLDEVEEWTELYDPKGITLSFDDPADALFKQPKKVLIENDTIQCFFKPCSSKYQSMRELKTYRKIAAAGLHHQLKVCSVYGVVMDDQDFILGILLTYINGARPLSCLIHPDDLHDPPSALRQKWNNQLDDTFKRLQEEGIIWGDVKAENVLVDQDYNAWVTGFGGGYTEGWVDEAIA